MSKIQVSVVSKNELRLEEDGKKGDIIDLNELKDFDTTAIENLIEQGRDGIYQKKLEEEKRHWENEKKSALQKVISDEEVKRTNLEADYKEKLSKVQNEKDSLNDTLEARMKAYKAELDKENQEKISGLQHQNELLEAKFEAEKKELDLKLKNEYQKQLNDLNTQITILKQTAQINLDKALLEKDKENQKIVDNIKQEKEDIQKQLDDVRLQKSSRSVKALGEELEHWCDEQYKQASTYGFENCTWDKDNITVNDEGEKGVKGGTKADYIFRVYFDEGRDAASELTSVCLDMKNENPLSTSKKKNADHYKKLDEDRKKKNCEYALLVSELEMNEYTDTPIYKVPNYDKMYMVRPQYMITMLSMIYALSKKYSQILTAKKEEEEKFKTKRELEAEFEDFKTTYLDKPLNSLNAELDSILKSSENIRKANEAIYNTANDIINKTIDNMRKKIETLSVKVEKNTYKKLDKLV